MYTSTKMYCVFSESLLVYCSCIHISVSIHVTAAWWMWGHQCYVSGRSYRVETGDIHHSYHDI